MNDRLRAQLAQEQAAALTPPTDTLRAALERTVRGYGPSDVVTVGVLRALLRDTQVANGVLHGVTPRGPGTFYVATTDPIPTTARPGATIVQVRDDDPRRGRWVDQGVRLVPVRTSAQLAAEQDRPVHASAFLPGPLVSCDDLRGGDRCATTWDAVTCPRCLAARTEENR